MSNSPPPRQLTQWPLSRTDAGRSPSPTIAPLPPAAAFGIAAWVLIARSKQRRHAAVVIRAFLRQRLCPCCTYDLSGLEPGADAYIACPECGAAWRVRSPEPDDEPSQRP